MGIKAPWLLWSCSPGGVPRCRILSLWPRPNLWVLRLVFVYLRWGEKPGSPPAPAGTPPPGSLPERSFLLDKRRLPQAPVAPSPYGPRIVGGLAQSCGLEQEPHVIAPELLDPCQCHLHISHKTLYSAFTFIEEETGAQELSHWPRVSQPGGERRVFHS